MPPTTIEEFFRRRTVAAENADATPRNAAATAIGLRDGEAVPQSHGSGSGSGVRSGCDVEDDGGRIGSAKGRCPSQVLQDLVNRNSRSRKRIAGLGLRRRRGNLVREYEVHGRLPPWASSRALTAALLFPTYRPVHEVVVENLDLLFDYSSWNRQPDSARDVSSMEFNRHGDMLLCSYRCGLVGFVSAADHLHRLWHESTDSATTAGSEDDEVASPPRRDLHANPAGADEDEEEDAERQQHHYSLERDRRGERRRRGSEEDGRDGTRATVAPEAAATALLSRRTALKPAHVVHFGAHDVDRARWCPTDETKVAYVGSTSSSVRVLDVGDFSSSSMRWEVLAQQGNAHAPTATHRDPLRNRRHGLKDVSFFPAASGPVRGLAALRRDGVVLVWDCRVHSTRGSSSSGGGSSSSSGGPAHGKHTYTSGSSSSISSSSKRQQQPVLQLQPPTDDLQQHPGTTTCIEICGEGLFVQGGTTRGLVHTWDVRGGGGGGSSAVPSSASSGFTFLNKALGLLPVHTLNVNPINSTHTNFETSASAAAAAAAAGTCVVSSCSAVQSLSLCPDDTSQLAFHLYSGVAGVVDLKYAQVTCSAAPQPPPTAAAASLPSEALSPTPSDRVGVGSSSSNSNRSFYGRGLAQPSPIGLPWLNGGSRDVSIGLAYSQLWKGATVLRRGCWLPSSTCFVCPSAHQPLLSVFDFGHCRHMAVHSTSQGNASTRQTHHNTYSTLALDCDSATSAAEAAPANATAVSVATHPRHWQIVAGMQSGVVLVMDSVARR